MAYMDITTGEMVDDKPKAAPTAKAPQVSTGQGGFTTAVQPKKELPLRHVAGGQQLWDQAQSQGQALRDQAAGLPGQFTSPEQYNQARQMNQGFVNQIGNYLNTVGKGPSVAETQLNQGMEQALAQQLAMAASQRGGGNVGLQQRQLAENQANIGQATNAQAALLRAQENQANQNLMLQGLGLQTQAGQQLQGMDQQMINAMLTQQLGRQQLARGFGQDQAALAQIQANAMASRYGANTQRAAAESAAQGQLAGGLAQGAGSFIGAIGNLF